MGRVLAIICVLAGVLALGVMSDRPSPPADLTYIEPTDMNTLDPQRMSHMQDFRLSYALYETLVRWDVLSPEFGIVRGAAERWQVSTDGLTYTFHLDPKGKWSSGDSVTAHDFVYAWRRGLMPDTAADYAELFQLIKGGKALFDFRAAQLKGYAQLPDEQRTREAAKALRAEADRFAAEQIGLRALDDLTLEVTLERPTPYFLDLCAFGPFAPVHPPTVERWLDADPATGMLQQRHGWTKPPHLVGNGPYVLERWRFKRDLRLERNPHFRDPTLARSGSIAILIIEDSNTGVLAFKGGSADLHIDLDVEYIGDMLDQVERGERDDLRHFTAFGTYFWNFNCTSQLADGRENPFADARVRRAFTLATDKQSIVSKVRRSREQIARGLIPPDSIPGFVESDGLPFDPERARRELESAGWVDRDSDGVPDNARGEPFPIVELLGTPVGGHKDIALAMASMWERALGVRTKVVIKETKVYRNTLKRRDYMMSRASWYGDYLDPLTFLDLHRTGDGNNDRGFSDPAYDALLEQADNTLDLDARRALLEQAERYAMEQAAPVLPIFHYDQYYLYRPATKPDGSPNPGGLRGMSTHPRLVQYLHLLEVVR